LIPPSLTLPLRERGLFCPVVRSALVAHECELFRFAMKMFNATYRVVVS